MVVEKVADQHNENQYNNMDSTAEIQLDAATENPYVYKVDTEGEVIVSPPQPQRKNDITIEQETHHNSSNYISDEVINPDPHPNQETYTNKTNLWDKIKTSIEQAKIKKQIQAEYETAKSELLENDILCLYCFNKINRNDVLFRKHDGVVEYDSINYKQVYSKNPHAIALKQKQILDWHHFHQDFLIIKNEIVECIIDSDGERVTEKICPHCHFPLHKLCNTVPTKIINVVCEQDSMCIDTINVMNNLISSQKDSHNLAIKNWKKEYSNFSGFNITNRSNPSYKNLLLLQNQNNNTVDRSRLDYICDSFIMITKPNLNIDQMTKGKLDIQMMVYISDFIKKQCNEDDTLSRPLAFCLDMNGYEQFLYNNDFSKFLDNCYTPLINFLDNHCLNYKIFPIAPQIQEYDSYITHPINWITK